MAYVAPVTRSTGFLVTAAVWNQDVVANVIALKDPPTDIYIFNEGANYTTTGTSFADVDATDLSLTITTTGGDVWISFTGNVNMVTTGDKVFFDVTQDGVRIGGDDGICGHSAEGAATVPGVTVTFTYLLQGVSAGSHTYNLQWKVDSGSTATMYAGAGTGNGDVHGFMWVREAS